MQPLNVETNDERQEIKELEQSKKHYQNLTYVLTAVSVLMAVILGVFVYREYATPSGSSEDPSSIPSSSSATALTVLFDESIGFNNYGACYEGDEEYITDCIMQSHFAGYLLMRKPTKAKGSCRDFGYEMVPTHPVWKKAQRYWSESKAEGMSFSDWNSTFYSKHPLLDEEYLRDGNPACNGGLVQDRSSAKLSPHDGHFLSIYDDIPVEDMTIRVCIDGTAVFMLECAVPSDPFPYILMKNPRVTEEPCATVYGGNYEYVQPDHRCPGYNQSWWHSKPYVAGESFLPFRDNHSLLTHFVEYNVAKNPTCQTAFCNLPNLETAECNESTPQWKTYNPLVPFPDRSIKPEPKELPTTPPEIRVDGDATFA